MAKIEEGTLVKALRSEHDFTAGHIYSVYGDDDCLYVIDDEGIEDCVSLSFDNMFEVMEGQSDESLAPNMVEHPSHYTRGKFETIEVIEEITAGYSDGFVAYNVGNALKYLARAPYKHDDGGLEDVKKAAKYLEFAIKRISEIGNR